MRKFLSLLVVLLTTVASAWADGSNLLSGKFSVSATKKVQFTKGNLYYSTTDNAYHLEPAQNATYGTGDGTYAATHVYHFFWVTPSEATTAATAPWAESFGTHTQTTSDKFFCGVDNPMSVDGTSGLYALTGGESGEWNYLINSRTNASNLYKYGVSVTTSAGTVANCLVIAPDDYDYTTNPLKASYTAEEWATAEAAGLVCLPAAGDRRGSYLDNGGDYGTYWSATSVDEYYENYLTFDNSSVGPALEDYPNYGHSVRLVKDAESTITEPEYVTIGGLRWATMNLGATTVADSPETSFGTYYSWAATSTIVSTLDWTKLTAWGTFDSTNGITFSKEGGYTNTNDPAWNGSSWTYSPTTGTTRSENFDSYDAAKAVLGDNWRMPSAEEFQALADACGSAKTYSSGDITEGGIYWINPAKGSSVTIDGVAYSVPGRLFVSSTDKTKRVFFPAAGFITGTSLSVAGTDGYYWSSSLSNTNDAYILYFYSDDVYPQTIDSRYDGLTVRPVQTPDYLCLTAEAANSSVTFKWASGSDVQTSTDGTTFNAYTAGTTITLNAGDKVYFKGTGVTTDHGHHFTMTGTIAASGDVTSLTNGTGGDVALAEHCYMYMFKNCASLTTAPNLPSTALAADCYDQMFQGCTSLTTAPELSATTLANSCYSGMFLGCTSLTTAPELPATILVNYCYSYMFNDCTSLTTAPALPATTLAEGCYSGMFYGCTSLTAAPNLPATILAECCYGGMFYGCTSLTAAPNLPATILEESCYSGMFYGCTSLTAAPNLPATILEESCYGGMFYGCTKLNKVTVNFTDWNTSGSATTDWLNNAGTDASVTSRTFICPAGLDVTTTKDASHVPEGWNVVNKQVSTEADLTTAISNAQAGETIQLTADIDLTAELNVASGKDFTLDLNGHVLKQTAQASVISNKGTLAIADNSAAKTGQITGGHPTNVGGGIYNEGTLNITGGTITGNTAGASGGGIYNRVNNSSAATVNMTGGKITGNKAGTNGGGILNYQGTVTLKDVTISKNAAKRGGAIYSTQGSSAVTVEDGTISENSAEHEGGIANFATLKLIGTNQCTITGNTSTMSDYPSGGVQIYLYDQTVTLKGKVIIKDNTTDGKTANLCLNGNTVPQQITLDGLTAGSEIGVTTMVGNNNVGFTVGAYQFTTNGSADDMQYFFSDDDKYAFWYNTDHFETSIIHRADADVDAEATVNDYSMVKNYILTPATTPAYPAKNVLFINADANDSKAIDASDLTVIVDGIYNDAANKAKVAPFQPSPSGQESVEGFNVAVNGNVLTISADNASAFLAAQMDITLPEGITIASAESAGHTIYNKVQEDGSTRVLIAGLQNNQFAGNTVATLTLSGNVDTSTGSAQAVDVDNAIFTNTAFQSVAAAANSTTGIVNVSVNASTSSAQADGKFIENGRVVILKNGKKYNAAGQRMK